VRRDAEETKRRIFAAASAEFARHGIAGARVDRITETAGVNNALLYRYFGNKRQLFDTVFSALSAQLGTAVPFTVEDLPGYVDALIRYYARHRDIVRISAWYRLERGDDDPPPEVVTSTASKVRLIVGRAYFRSVNSTTRFGGVSRKTPVRTPLSGDTKR